MSKSGRKYRDPFALDAQRRKAGPIDKSKRRMLEELKEEETHQQAHEEFDERFGVKSKCFREEEESVDGN